MEQYREEIGVSEPIRKLYADSIQNAVLRLRKAAQEERRQFISPEAMRKKRNMYRSRYGEMLGIDVCERVFGYGMPECVYADVGNDALCKIERMKIKISDGIYFTGLLLTPREHREKMPLIIMCHGGGGSPELCCDMLGNNNYGGVVRKILAQGCMVFAPQLLLWNLAPSLCESAIPTYSTPYDRGASDSSFKQCGTSIAGFEIYCISRSLDLLLHRRDVSCMACGMLGLSYGGFYTLYTMAYDTRIQSGWAAAFFNDRTKYAWADMVWKGSGRYFLDPEIVGLCAPRRLVCDMGKEDTVFSAEGVEELFPYTAAYYAACHADGQLRLNIWNGGHKFCPDSLEFFMDGVKNI